MAVIVVTDSSSTLPAEITAGYGIRVVPLHILADGRDLREGVDEIPGSVWRSAHVSTAGASPQEMRDAFDEAVRASGGDGVVGVFISRQLSSTWDAARQAADERVGVRIVDSAAAGLGLGFAVRAAAIKAAEGASLDEVYKTAVDAAARATSFVYVNQLDNLRRGGRIGTAAAVFGTALAIKPVLQLSGGKLAVREKTRTSSKALARLVDAAVDAASTSGDGAVCVAVQHLEAEERARGILTQMRDRLPQVHETLIGDLGAVLGVHLGPGALSISLFRHTE
ncbi:DegV family protein [Hoyosella sp. YIM 151337]|uniref:DegV family protein n=1 Tax=Hoyosella sp. YIM 151337 TaxID=2992742 RepID=UPI002235A628|nr:DegV family protein [Hoyosella sp. YIM 151337]MCW4355269.1 DegV family protein [Hoyosella sp. YIM 151337]